MAWAISQSSVNRTLHEVEKVAVAWVGAICEKALLSHCRLSNDTERVDVDGTAIAVSVGGDIFGWDAVLHRCIPSLHHAWMMESAAPNVSMLHRILQFASVHTNSSVGDNAAKALMRQVIFNISAGFVSPFFDQWVVYIYAAEERIDRLPILYRKTRVVGTIDPGV